MNPVAPNRARSSRRSSGIPAIVPRRAADCIQPWAFSASTAACLPILLRVTVKEDERLDHGPAPEDLPEEPRSRRRWLLPALIGGVFVLVLGGLAIAAFSLSGSSLETDTVALAQVETEALGGNVESVHATNAAGKTIPVAVHGGRLVPKRPLSPGETVTVDVVVKRPGAIGWLVGSESHQQLTIQTPSARVRSRWLTVKPSSPPRVRFDQPVSSVAYGVPGHLHHRSFATPKTSISLGTQGSRRHRRRRRRPALLGATGQAAERHLVPRRATRRASPPAPNLARRSRRRRRCASPSRSRSPR